MVKIRGKERTEVRRLLNDYRLISAKSISDRIEEATRESVNYDLHNDELTEDESDINRT